MAKRREVYDLFTRIDNAIVVATSSFGTGIDVQDTRYVIQLGLAFSRTDLVQKFGRVGRDGKAASAEVLFNREDIIKTLNRDRE